MAWLALLGGHLRKMTARLTFGANLITERAGIAGDIRAGSSPPTAAAGCGKNLKKRNRRTPSPETLKEFGGKP